jgi:hypothetical protein
MRRLTAFAYTNPEKYLTRRSNRIVLSKVIYDILDRGLPILTLKAEIPDSKTVS